MIVHVNSHQNEPSQKSIQKELLSEKKQNLFKKPRKSIQKKHTLPKTNIKKKQGFVSMLKCAVS